MGMLCGLSLKTKKRVPHPLTANGSSDLVIIEVSFELGGHVVFKLLLLIWFPL